MCEGYVKGRGTGGAAARRDFSGSGKFLAAPFGTRVPSNLPQILRKNLAAPPRRPSPSSHGTRTLFLHSFWGLSALGPTHGQCGPFTCILCGPPYVSPFTYGPCDPLSHTALCASRSSVVARWDFFSGVGETPYYRAARGRGEIFSLRIWGNCLVRWHRAARRRGEIFSQDLGKLLGTLVPSGAAARRDFFLRIWGNSLVPWYRAWMVATYVKHICCMSRGVTLAVCDGRHIGCM